MMWKLFTYQPQNRSDEFQLQPRSIFPLQDPVIWNQSGWITALSGSWCLFVPTYQPGVLRLLWDSNDFPKSVFLNVASFPQAARGYVGRLELLWVYICLIVWLLQSSVNLNISATTNDYFFKRICLITMLLFSFFKNKTRNFCIITMLSAYYTNTQKARPQ